MHLIQFSLLSAMYTLLDLPHPLAQAITLNTVFKHEVFLNRTEIFFFTCSLSWSPCRLSGKLEWVVFPLQMNYSSLAYKLLKTHWLACRRKPWHACTIRKQVWESSPKAFEKMGFQNTEVLLLALNRQLCQSIAQDTVDYTATMVLPNSDWSRCLNSDYAQLRNLRKYTL